jgi:colicin import membrane protein
MNAPLEGELMPDTSSGTDIAEFKATEAALAKLQEAYDGAQYDVTTPAGMLAATQGRRELRELRVDIEKRRKELKAPLIEQGRHIEDEAKRITAALVALEDPIDAQIQAEQKRRDQIKEEEAQAKRDKLAGIQKRIARISEEPVLLVGKPVAEVEARLEVLRATVLDPEVYGEYHQQAVEALAEMLPKAEGVLVAARAHEAAQAELAAGRAALAAREAEEAERNRAENEAREAERARADAAAVQARADADAAASVERERLAGQEELIRQLARLDTGSPDDSLEGMARYHDSLMAATHLFDGIHEDMQERAEVAAMAAIDRVAARVSQLQQAAAREAELAAREAQARADADAAAAERQRLEAEHLANVTLHDAALSAHELLVKLGQGEHVTTRALHAALSRS